MDKKLISIVVPVYNEEANITICYEELTAALQPIYDNYDFEYIFIDNCSEDGSFQKIEEIVSKDKRVKLQRHV